MSPRFLFQSLLVAFLLGWAAPASANFSTVVVDAGHGGHNLGQTVAGVHEKWLALDTSIRLERYLRANGLRTVMTRRGDYFVPLPERVTIANRYARNSVFVSVHYNGAANRGAAGLETFYYGRSGYDLAVRVQRQMVRAVRGNDRGVKFGRFHVIRHTKQPAILVECGFLTNDAERRRCTNGQYRQAIAEAIGRGIIEYRNDLRRGRAR